MAKAKHDLCPKCSRSYADTHKCVQCPQCGNHLANAVSLKKHEKRVHEKQELKFKCKTCGKGFSTTSICKTHERTVHIDSSLRPMEQRRRKILSMGMSFQFSPYFS